MREPLFLHSGGAVSLHRMRNPLVTVVTPSFNQGHFIRATIESVLSQDYSRIEYIVMDGGSKDETAQVVREYASRLKFVSERDRGQSDAINKGFQMAKGEVVSWLNSDDTILPGAISHAVRAFEANPAAGAVYGEGYLLDYDGNVTGRFPVTEPFNLWKLVHLSDYILQQTVYFRRAVLEEIGWVDQKLHYVMDWDLLIRIGKRYELVYIPEYMGCLREYGTAKTFAGGATRVAEIGEVLRRETGDWLPPGYVVYGLDAYSKIWYEAIDEFTPGILRGASEKFKTFLARSIAQVIGGRIHASQGWFSDGWATTQAHFMLPPGSGDLMLRGSLPEWASWLRGQSIRVDCDGRTVGELALPVGDFDISIPIKARRTGGALRLTVLASRYFVPNQVQENAADGRRLSYLLKSFGWR